MEIPKLNISVTKAAVNGQILDVVEYDEYAANPDLYINKGGTAIPVDYKGKELLLPIKGKYNGNPISPGIYNAGCIDFISYPEEPFIDNYVSNERITMSNTDTIRDLIIAEEAIKKLDEAFITSPDNITTIHIKDNDNPEMKALKMALNAKKIDINKYASRFGDNFSNDKRQLNSQALTLKILKRYCDNCDMEAILTIKDKNENVPNPMGKVISVSLTELNDDLDPEEESCSYDTTDDEGSDYNLF